MIFDYDDKYAFKIKFKHGLRIYWYIGIDGRVNVLTIGGSFNSVEYL